MNRLWVKLTLAFLAISLAAIGVVAVVSLRATGEQFRQYVVSSGMAGQPGWAQTLAEYYATHGSWDGVAELLAQLGPGGTGMGRGRGATGVTGPNLAVADTAGRVLASKTGELIGELLPANVLAQGLPLVLNGQPIGTLLNVRSADVVLDAQGQAFLPTRGVVRRQRRVRQPALGHSEPARRPGPDHTHDCLRLAAE